ncbi:MAG TPA: hydrogenase maturation protease [Acidobacteriota bacterium]|nr:hydrogenase maturation protease [Acidobacteriota bacterium]
MNFIIGIGNDFRSDDAVGLVIARRLKACHINQFTVIEFTSDGAALLDYFQQAEVVILVDAVSSGATPGTIHRLDAHREVISKQYFQCSTHTVSVAEAIELGRVLGILPQHLLVVGIEAVNFSPGVGLSPPVEKVVDQVVEQIQQQ